MRPPPSLSVSYLLQSFFLPQLTSPFPLSTFPPLFPRRPPSCPTSCLSLSLAWRVEQRLRSSVFRRVSSDVQLLSRSLFFSLLFFLLLFVTVAPSLRTAVSVSPTLPRCSPPTTSSSPSHTLSLSLCPPPAFPVYAAESLIYPATLRPPSLPASPADAVHMRILRTGRRCTHFAITVVYYSFFFFHTGYSFPPPSLSCLSLSPSSSPKAP